ncbi:MAG: peptidoglycan editing factor PgeF [Rickettsia endosymbiont of Bryobia graminum]|nr:peptidoglycan editing factor PgeF [Rickettsia endosymbiont of Bryobia graminum]
MNELIKNKVYYKIFDLSFNESNHIYNKKNSSISAHDIQNNRNFIINYYQAENIFILHQEHTTDIIDADLLKDYDTNIVADGSVTTKGNLILAIQTADCAPVLLTSKDGLVIGAAHCGWRGAKEGIVHNLVKLMENKGAKNLSAVIGPAIAQFSYEVDSKFHDNFIKQQTNNSQFFIPSSKAEHYMFDLPSYVEQQLQQSGIDHIIKISQDTYSTKLTDNKHKYPSYRRSCHTKEPYKASILSTIMIKNI